MSGFAVDFPRNSASIKGTVHVAPWCFSELAPARKDSRKNQRPTHFCSWFADSPLGLQKLQRDHLYEEYLLILSSISSMFAPKPRVASSSVLCPLLWKENWFDGKGYRWVSAWTCKWISGRNTQPHSQLTWEDTGLATLEAYQGCVIKNQTNSQNIPDIRHLGYLDVWEHQILEALAWVGGGDWIQVWEQVLAIWRKWSGPRALGSTVLYLNHAFIWLQAHFLTSHVWSRSPFW